ncbi:MAG: hypothetical protein HY727_09780 [Candidatus Rokubacteria bacterium]|nr:hypothetical protein [Candidatus Rokubacteria bacterium]
MPVPYIEQVRRMYPDLPAYQWAVNERAPLTPLRKPLRECRVALVSSAGVYLPAQPAFRTDAKDVSFREIPADADVETLLVGHPSTAAAVTDLDTVFPLDRLRELARAGVLGGLASPALSFVGRVLSRGLLRRDMVPWLVERLRALDVDAAFFVPV